MKPFTVVWDSDLEARFVDAWVGANSQTRIASHWLSAGGDEHISDAFSGGLPMVPSDEYDVIIKDYRNASMINTPSEMVGTQRTGIRGIGENEKWSICTSHIERHNGTNRAFMKRLNRLTYAFSKKLKNLEAAFAMWIAYYKFCWQTRHSDQSGKWGRKRPSAAMMARLTGHVWSFHELFDVVLKP